MLFSNAAIIRLETVDSTNNYAANLLKLSSVPEGTVITALEQTEGRGQRGAKWISAKDENLLCSVILYPVSIKPENQFLISQTIALAVREFVEEAVERDAYIKWPNDIIVGDRKVAGILIETNWSENKAQSCIVGIGINVNQKKMNAPNAQALSEIVGHFFALETCLQNLLKKVERYYLKLLKQDAVAIRKLYQSYLYRLHQNAKYVYQGETIEAMILGVELSGKLRLKNANGQEFLCDIKEIAMVWD